MDINFRLKCNDVYKPLINSDKRYLVFKGGAGSGKSVFAIQKVVYRCLAEPGHRILCVRKVAKTLRGSIYQAISDLIVDSDLGEFVKVNKSEFRFSFITGSEIILAGMDDPEKIKSIAGITSVFVEEATELTEKDFNQLELRVRGFTKYYKQFILAFNPIDEGHWLKRRFFDFHDSDVLAMTTTYRDNKFLDTEYIHHLETRVKNNENLYRIYVQGEWGKPLTGAEFYKQFTMSKHVDRIQYNPELPLHLSFDFNVHPGMHLGIFQLVGKEIRMVDEMQAKTPNNNTKSTCRLFAQKYSHHNSGLFIYGDPSGKADDTRGEMGHNDFRIIEMELSSYRPQMRVLSKAPSVAMRGQFINAVFADEYDGIKFIVDPSCKIAIDDFQYTKEDSDGTKKKERIKDSDTGISYEKYGHMTDLFDYLICYAYRDSYERFQKGDVKESFILGSVRQKSKY